MSYIRAIHGKDSAVRIAHQALECSTWAEPDFEVRQEVTTYHFSNGVSVRRTLEEDSIASAAACTECWITYEVLPENPAGLNVQPSRRMFDSRCRESFWIRFHSESAIADDTPQ